MTLILYLRFLEIQFGHMLGPTYMEGALKIYSLSPYTSLIVLSLMTKVKFGL